MVRPSFQRIVLAISVALIAGAPALAQPPRQDRGSVHDPADPALTRQDARGGPVDAALMQMVHNRNLAPGYAIVVHDGRVVLAKGWGPHAGPGSGPADGHDLFRIASVTKTFTALGVLVLVDEGKLALDDPIERWIPGAHVRLKLPRDRQPTIRDVLYHFSGLPRAPKDPKSPTERDLVATLNAAEVSPGRRFRYSNLAFSLLGIIIARASGEPYYTFMAHKVFEPLGITDEVWHPQDVPRDRLVMIHSGSPGHWQGTVDTHDFKAGNPAGGLYLSGDDMVKFVKWELGQQQNGPLRPETLALSHRTASQTLRPPGSGTPKQPMFNSGMGWDLAPSSAKHDILAKNGRLPNHWTAIVGIEPSTGTGAVLFVSSKGGAAVAEAKTLITAARGAPR